MGTFDQTVRARGAGFFAIAGARGGADSAMRAVRPGPYGTKLGAGSGRRFHPPTPARGDALIGLGADSDLLY